MQQTSKNFVTSFAAQDHLDAHGLDFPTEKVHGGACTDSGDIVSFQMIDDFRECVQAFLHREYIFMVNSPEEVCSFSRSEKIRRIFQSN